MSLPKKIVGFVFDNDGTLVDSMPAHVRFCHHVNEKYQFGLSLPAPDDRAACRKVTGNPMDNFLRNCGFPEEKIQMLFSEYKSDFKQNFPVTIYTGIPELIDELHKMELKLAIVSHNTVANIEEAIGGMGPKFTNIFGIDNSPTANKSDTLMEVAKVWSCEPDQIVYVADTKYDCDCALKHNIPFLGLTWGYEDLLNVAESAIVKKSDNTPQLRAAILKWIGKDY